MFYGTIKRLEQARGFGFIETGGRDVYFHATDIGDEVFRQLQVNQPVTFEYAPRPKDVEREQLRGPRAIKMKLIERLPGGVLETPQDLAPKHHPKARQRRATWKRRIDVSGSGDAPPGESG
jgi:cold shock CspA family protein